MKKKNGNVIKKVISVLIVVIALFVFNGLVNLFFDFDGNWNKNVYELLIIFMAITSIFSIFNKTTRKKFIIFTVLLLSLNIVNLIYYDIFSMKLEPLLYLHNKYNYKLSNMKIIESEGYSDGGFLYPGNNRNARIKYNDTYIYVYYKDGWKDNQGLSGKYGTKNKRILEDMDSIMKESFKDYKIVIDPQLNALEEDNSGYTSYGYIIYLHSTSEEMIAKTIKKLDDYVARDDTSYIIYGLYIFKDDNIYNKVIGQDLSVLYDEESYGQTYPDELFKLIGYKTTRISFVEGFNKEVFINNGDKEDDEYNDPSNFDYIVFWYSAERNSFASANGTELMVFGIKK